VKKALAGFLQVIMIVENVDIAIQQILNAFQKKSANGNKI